MSGIEVVAIGGTVIGVFALCLFWFTTTEKGIRFFNNLEKKIKHKDKTAH